MAKLFRSINTPLRDGLSWDEKWEGSDDGLILCWERGREKSIAELDLAARAKKGELVTLAWKGGTENVDDDKPKKGKSQKRYATFRYLATWQGLRGEPLDIDMEGERIIICTKTKKAVIFRLKLPEEAKK